MTPYRYLLEVLFPSSLRSSVVSLLPREELQQGVRALYFVGNYTHCWHLGENGSPVQSPTQWHRIEVPLYRFDTATLERGLRWMLQHVYRADPAVTYPTTPLDLGDGLVVDVVFPTTCLAPPNIGGYVVRTRDGVDASNVYLLPRVCDSRAEEVLSMLSAL